MSEFDQEPDHATVIRHPDNRWSVKYGSKEYWVWKEGTVTIEDKSTPPEPEFTPTRELRLVIPARRRWWINFPTGPYSGTTLLVNSFDYIDNYDHRNKGSPWVQGT